MPKGRRAEEKIAEEVMIAVRTLTRHQERVFVKIAQDAFGIRPARRIVAGVGIEAAQGGRLGQEGLHFGPLAVKDFFGQIVEEQFRGAGHAAQ
ncbi:MAG: hypothetical protein HY784_10450 [Chloroflexi bacterium]|nr:hypothetical protein [Chloroflexota bacterium]